MDDVLLLVGSFQVSAVTWVDFSPRCDRLINEPRLTSGGGLSGLPGVSNGTSLSAWGCVYVCYSPMVTALMSMYVYWENMFHNACSLKVSSCKQHYALCIYLCRITGCYFSVSLKYMCAPRWRFIAAFLRHTNTHISSNSLRHAYTQETTCSGM